MWYISSTPRGDSNIHAYIDDIPRRIPRLDPPTSSLLQIQRDGLQDLLDLASRHHPDCTLQIATFGLNRCLDKKQAKNPVSYV